MSQYCALVVFVLSILAFAGYIYGVADLYGNTSYIPIAAMTFVVLSAGVLCARPERGLMAVVTSRNLGGVVARRLLPAAILVPLVLGWFRLRGQQIGLYGTELGVSLFTVATMVIVAALVWWSARLLYRFDGERRRAVEEMRIAQGEGRGGQPRQERVPGEHEPRDPHPHERRYRDDGPPPRYSASTTSNASTPRRCATRARACWPS